MMVVWTALIVIAFAVGLRYGAEGVAAAYSVMALLLAAPICFYTVRQTPIRFRDVAHALRYPVIATVLSGGFGFMFKVNAAGWHTSLRAVTGCGGVFALYAILLLLVFRQWPFYRDLIRHLSPRTTA